MCTATLKTTKCTSTSVCISREPLDYVASYIIAELELSWCGFIDTDSSGSPN